ncbi:MAG: MarR family transcriptional regulator [Desulfosarcinaceae bacterium]|nr:MarR family transcriptional regulator [Desulfosarcinaceae bacterium]
MIPNPPNTCIFFQLSRASRKALRYWKRRLADIDAGVTAVQAMVLLFLHDEDHVTSAELGGRAHLDSATLAGVLDRLQEVALVKRRPHPADGRSIQVCLTAAGRRLATRLEDLKMQANADFLAGLTPEEEMILRALLTKMVS